MRVAGLVLLLLSVSLPSSGQQPAGSSPAGAAVTWDKEPDGYRGLTWGTTVAAAAEVLDSAERCLCMWGGDDNSLCKAKPEKDPKKVPPSRVCFTTFEVGPVQVEDQITFLNDSLAAASMSFDTDHYEKMREIFIDKYGPPTSRESKEVQNRMGATFQQEELEWKGKTTTVSLNRYGSKLTQGAAYLLTNAYRDHVQATAEAEKKKGSKAF